MLDAGLMTPKEAAAYLNVSKQLIYKWLYERRFVHVRIGRKLLIRREYLDAWVKLNEVRPWS